VRRSPPWLGAVALAAALALPPDAAVARSDASSAAACKKETKRLNSFKRGMTPAKRRYFRRHSSKKARTRFVRAQRRKLARLKRARTRCLANKSPGGGPPSGGPPTGGPPSGGPPTGGPGPPTAGTAPITVGQGTAFLVATAEGDDDLEEFPDANFNDSVSAADQDATASATASSSLQVTSTGMEFSGTATISATDDGDGGDASVFIDRGFAFADSMPYRLSVTLGGIGNETTGRIQLRVTPSSNPFFSRTTTGSETVNGSLQGPIYFLVEVACSPGNAGGTCTGNFSYKFEVGDMIGP
jgi:hypothetical protein